MAAHNGIEEDEDLIKIWTTTFLREFERQFSRRSRHRPNTAPDRTTVVFGRTTHIRDSQAAEAGPPSAGASANEEPPISDGAQAHRERSRLPRRSLPCPSGRDGAVDPDTASLGIVRPKTLDDSHSLSSSVAPSEAAGRRPSAAAAGGGGDSSQDHKHRGRQMFASTGAHDRSKAQEKRKRQMGYSREIRHASSSAGAAAASSSSSSRGGRTRDKSTVALQVDSITRVVVQSFRKLINCERCALFLMDHGTNELYFKPLVGNGHHESASHVKTIRFPATTGVAGWVASRKEKLNIRNAYQDPRFNQEIDKQTNFRTRTILCMPVLSSSGHLFGVIQMVNKLKGDAKILKDTAKKKKSDDKNHGYNSCYESFSYADERLLERCTAQVTRALEEVLLPNRTAGGNAADAAEELYLCDSSTDKRRRRSSIGGLVQFVSAESGAKANKGTNKESFGEIESVAEALLRFQFRGCVKGPQISVRGQPENDPDRVVAQERRQRMIEYAKKQQAGRDNQQVDDKSETSTSI